MPWHHLADKSGIVYEHKLVAEKILNRELKDGEIVHHIDENKYNNSQDNLMVFASRADHAGFHKGLKATKVNDVYICLDKGHINKDKTNRLNKCPICGKSKSIDASMCWECYNNKREKHIPSKEELKEKLLHRNFLYISKLYNVTDNTIRKWCKKYCLPYKTSELIKMSDEEIIKL